MAEQLSGMIHEILEASRNGNSLKNEPPVEMDLTVMLPALCEPYEQIAGTRNVIFHLDLDSAVSAKVPPKLFRKAVSNILANAITYTNPGKTVSVYFNGTALVIENECEPIPTETLQHLFEPFYRPDYARNRDDGGNGLGLYIVDTLLKGMKLPYSFRPMEHPLGMQFIIYL